jgi:hypothetical protein
MAVSDFSHYVEGFQSLGRSQNSHFDRERRCTTPDETRQREIQSGHLDSLEHNYSINTNDFYDKIMRTISGERDTGLLNEVSDYLDYASPQLTALAGKTVYRGSVGFQENVLRFISNIRSAQNEHQRHQLLHSALHSSSVVFKDSSQASTSTVDETAWFFLNKRHQEALSLYLNSPIERIKFIITVHPSNPPIGMALDEGYYLPCHEIQFPTKNRYDLNGDITTDASGAWEIPIIASNAP